MRLLSGLLTALLTGIGLAALPPSGVADPLPAMDRPSRVHSVQADTTCPTAADGLQRRAPDTLVSTQNLLDAAPATAGPTSVHAVVEIPAGTAEKWEVAANGRALAIEQRDGQRRRIDYLPYPANYGFIPRTRSTTASGGDGDPLDVVLLGPATPCGAVVQARVIGALRLMDDGERDHKLLAVRPSAPLGEVETLGELEDQFPGVLDILETWFLRYQGPGNRSDGFMDAEAARSAVSEAAARSPSSSDR